MHSMADRLLNVLAANNTVLIYSGVLDYICKSDQLRDCVSYIATGNYKGGAAWTAALPWPGQAGFNAATRTPWNIRLTNGTSYSAGTSQVYKNFAWLEVNNAGHMCPMVTTGLCYG
jgi:carboxypeptidase C (cathepsin A)